MFVARYATATCCRTCLERRHAIPAGRALDDEQGYAVECGINRLKRHHAGAPRHDKLAVRYEGTVLVAAINEWL